MPSDDSKATDVTAPELGAPNIISPAHHQQQQEQQQPYSQR